MLYHQRLISKSSMSSKYNITYVNCSISQPSVSISFFEVRKRALTENYQIWHSLHWQNPNGCGSQYLQLTDMTWPTNFNLFHSILLFTVRKALPGLHPSAVWPSYLSMCSPILKKKKKLFIFYFILFFYIFHR